MSSNSQITILIGDATLTPDFQFAPTYFRRRAERIVSATARRTFLNSHAWLTPQIHIGQDGGTTTALWRNPHWSLSRRGNYFCVALHSDDFIGIDLEQVNATADLDAVASHYFPARLYEVHKRLPKENRSRHFTASWSALEAVAKLRSLPLESAGTNLDTAVLYQSWFDTDMVLSIALNQEKPMQFSMLIDADMSALKRVSPFSPKEGL